LVHKPLRATDNVAAVFPPLKKNVNNTVDCDTPLSANDNVAAVFHPMFSNVNNTVDCDTPPNLIYYMMMMMMMMSIYIAPSSI